MSKLSIEEKLSRAIRKILESEFDAKSIIDVPEMREVLNCLEYFLPVTLAKLHPYWKGESLDGLFLADVKRIDPETLQLLGVCILISDQTTTPFQTRLRVSQSKDEISWMECRLGRRGPDKGGMQRISWKRWRDTPLVALSEFPGAIEWAYRFRFSTTMAGDHYEYPL